MGKIVHIYVEGVSQEQLDDAVENLQDQIDALGGSSILAPTVVDGDTTHAPTGEAVFEAIKVVQNDVDTHEARVDNPHSVTASQIGAEQMANKGQANGYVPLNSSSQIPQQYLPSFVDDVLEFANLAAFPGTGETGKIYVAIDTGRQYRWSGSAYIQITNGLIASTDDLPEGSTNKYSTNNRILNYVLTGLTAAASRVLPDAADSIITAWGKVLKYLSDLGSAAFLNVGTTAGTVRAGDDLRFKDVSSYRKTGTATLERWYSNAISGYAPTSSGNFYGNILRGFPIIISENQSWDRIGLEVTIAGSAGSVIRLGLYNSSNCIPTNRIADYGTVPADSLGVKTIEISETLSPGLYFFALNHNSTTPMAFRCVPYDYCLPVLGSTSTFGTTTTATSITSSLTYTTMPSTFPTSGMTATTGHIPDIRVRLLSI